MTSINTTGLTFLGPGSEWFWAAFQAVIVAVSLWGLFAQVRMQTAQKRRDDVASLHAEYDSERMLRFRIVVWRTYSEGSPVTDQTLGAFIRLQNFWESVAGFTKDKHLDKQLMAEHMGSDACFAWVALQPYLQDEDEGLASRFEWFVTEAIRIDPDLAPILELPRDRFARGVTIMESLLDVEVALRN